MKQRFYERVPLNIQVTVIHENAEYSGTVRNCSKAGMYVETSMSHPFESTLTVLNPFRSRLKIHIPCEGEDLEVPVKVKRLVKKENNVHGMGVELLDLPKEYAEFIMNLKSVKKFNIDGTERP